MDDQAWLQLRQYGEEQIALARQVLEQIRRGRDVFDAIRRNPRQDGGYLGKHVLVAAYRQLVQTGEWQPDESLLRRIRMKPVRTLSGVTTVTVLTKPYPCPGKCIFCPTDVRMPKSYIPDEPGARRALQHDYDPYAQVAARIEALEAIGHPADKVELLILGGTWSAYRRDYQEWFILRCFDALNGVDSASLEEAFTRNEAARHRNVGLVIETRPDNIHPEELANLRRLGVTKIQMGVQSLDDEILRLNQRGHTLAETQRAVSLARAAGFKLVLHWMPNLLGATPDSDRDDFARLWQDLCPDEIKIYPNQLLREAELYQYWLRGEYRPFTTQQLIALIADIKPTIPRYCRVNRVIRDIPSTYVVEGNRRTSLRQDVHTELRRRGQYCQCVRCREVREQAVQAGELHLEELAYQAGGRREYFLSFVTQQDKLAGFLRLSLPDEDSPEVGMAEVDGAGVIREVHVYGQSLPVGEEHTGAAQHAGLGTRLIQRAEELTLQAGLKRLAVISAVGTRRYYASRGFQRGQSYMWKALG